MSIVPQYIAIYRDILRLYCNIPQYIINIWYDRKKDLRFNLKSQLKNPQFTRKSRMQYRYGQRSTRKLANRPIQIIPADTVPVWSARHRNIGKSTCSDHHGRYRTSETNPAPDRWIAEPVPVKYRTVARSGTHRQISGFAEKSTRVPGTTTRNCGV